MKSVRLFVVICLVSLLTSGCFDLQKNTSKPEKHDMESLFIDKYYKKSKSNTKPFTPVATQQQTPQELLGTWIITKERIWEENKTGYEDLDCVKDLGYKNLYEDENFQVTFCQNGTCCVRNLNTTYKMVGNSIVLANGKEFKIIKLYHNLLVYEEFWSWGSSCEYTLLRDSVIMDSIANTPSDDDYLDDDFPYELLFLL